MSEAEAACMAVVGHQRVMQRRSASQSTSSNTHWTIGLNRTRLSATAGFEPWPTQRVQTAAIPWSGQVSTGPRTRCPEALGNAGYTVVSLAELRRNYIVAARELTERTSLS